MAVLELSDVAFRFDCRACAADNAHLLPCERTPIGVHGTMLPLSSRRRSSASLLYSCYCSVEWVMMLHICTIPENNHNLIPVSSSYNPLTSGICHLANTNLSQ